MSCHGQQYTCSNCGSGALKQWPPFLVHFYTSPVVFFYTLLFLGIEKSRYVGGLSKEAALGPTVSQITAFTHTQSNYFSFEGIKKLLGGKKNWKVLKVKDRVVWLTMLCPEECVAKLVTQNWRRQPNNLLALKRFSPRVALLLFYMRDGHFRYCRKTFLYICR